MRRRWSAGLVALGWACAPGSAWALLQGCTVSATAVNFGIYNPLSATPMTATGTVTMQCTALVGLFEVWTITLSAGGSGTYTNRTMANGSSHLSYNIYTSPAFTTVWGDGSGATGTNGGSALLQIGTTDFYYYAYGRLPAGQDSAAGTFTDNIVVTVNY